MHTDTKEIFEIMKQTSKKVDLFLITWLDKLKTFDKELHAVTIHLPMLRAGLKRGRPKVRSTTGRLSFEAVCERNWEEIIPILASTELIALSTYVLDDILDNQPKRDGTYATWTKFGLNSGIIAGLLQRDIGEKMLYSLKIDRLGIDEKSFIEILELSCDIDYITYIGQFLNEKMTNDISIDYYIDRCYKIGGIFTDRIAQMCSIAGGVSRSDKENLMNFGKHYGIALQIRNDLSNLIPQEIIKKRSQALRRTSYEDIRKGLWSGPIIFGMQEANTSDKEYINKILGNKNATDDELVKLTKLLIDIGAIEKTVILMKQHQSLAEGFVNNLSLDKGKGNLLKLISLLGNIVEYINLFDKEVN